MNTFKTLKPEIRHNLLILFATALLFWVSITILLPILPSYVEDLGGTKQQIGLVMGAFAIGLICSRPWVGSMTDRQGRKLVVLIGVLVAAIAPVGYLFITSVPALMVVRAFHGISIASFTTGYSALVTDLSPVKQRGEIIGYMTLAVPLGMAIGPALGGLLEAYGGYHAIFTISVISGVLASILATQIQERSDLTQLSPTKDNLGQHQRSWGEMLTSRSLVVPGLVLLLIGLVFGTLATFLPLFIRELKLDVTLNNGVKLAFNAGWFYTAAAFASFAARVFVGQASDRFGRGLFISLSLVCYALSMILLSLGNNSSIFLVSAILEGSGNGVLLPMIIALISDRSHIQERGRVFSVCVGGFDMGMAIAGPVFGYLSWDYRNMFAVAASLAGLALLLFFSQSNKNLTHSWRFALGRDKDRYALD